MPATESTWRDQGLLNRLFAVSGVILAIVTVLMFYRDHDRPWKHVQPKALEADLKLNAWRQEQFETADAMEEHANLEEELSRVSATEIPAALIEQFKAELENDAAYRKTTVDVDWIDAEAAEIKKLVEAAVPLREAATAAIKAAEAAPSDVAAQQDAAKAQAAALAAEKQAGDARAALIVEFEGYARSAKIRETQAATNQKGKNGFLDAAKANYDIAVRDNNAATMKTALETVRKLEAERDALREATQTLSTHRANLDGTIKAMTADIAAAQKKLDDSRAGLVRLEKTYAEKRETYFVGTFPFLGKKVLTFPIIDAFGSPRKIETAWSEGLEQDYNFKKVKRYDRCTTCHQSMAKSVPGMPTTQAFVKETTFDLVITPPTPEELGPPKTDAEGNPLPYTLEQYLGIRLAAEGLINRDDVTVKFVKPKSAAARAVTVGNEPTGDKLGEDIRVAAAIGPGSKESVELFKNLPGIVLGDVIQAINGDRILDARRAESYLIDASNSGKPITVTIRRGLPSPFTSHPRLDLFVSDSSPHKLSTFACTVCHDGQGSATDFKWASHTPNNNLDAERWMNEYGWFDNAHWIYPMFPKRFAEASCLKCHHEVVELEASERFPDPPAPSLVHGYHVIRKYGCYGCHEVNGYDGPTRRVGPDMRLEPGYFAVAQSMQPYIKAPLAAAQEKFNAAATAFDTASAAGEPPAEVTSAKNTAAGELAQIQELAKSTNHVVHHPEDNEVRTRLRLMIEEDAVSQTPLFPAEIHTLAGMLKDIEAPGDLRKSGPSLRYLGAKLDRPFLYDWLWNPQAFRPSTRMPRFFQLWDHLDADDHMAQVREPIEILGMMEYFSAFDQEFEPLPRPEGISEWSDEEKIARGKQQFEVRGCLACHNHGDFPTIEKYRKPGEIVQGPDLTGIGSKFDPARNPQGREWLYSWIKEPTKYHVRTVMPNLYLTPEKDAAGKVFDPVDDITAYLLSNKLENWTPVAEGSITDTTLTKENKQALDEHVKDYLLDAFYKDRAEEYLQNGIPAEIESELKGAEKELIVRDGGKLTDKDKLRYVGMKTISKYGCYGCHDIPGFEDAKPIGTGLADWGRKDPSKLAFEHITHYLEHHGPSHKPKAKEETPAPSVATTNTSLKADAAHDAHAEGDHSHAHNWPSSSGPAGSEADEEFYLHQLEAHNRIGFIHQKLKEPRSYDFQKTINKKYNERLRMPLFPISVEEREAIMTFVLGLVADPPREKYIFTPDARKEALIKGQQVLEKYNCGGCHILEAETWNIAYAAGDYGPQGEFKDFPFLKAHFGTKELEAQAKPDSRNLLTSKVKGLPPTAKDDGLPIVIDMDGVGVTNEDEFDPRTVSYSIDLYQPAMIDGSTYQTGGSSVQIPFARVESSYPANGGVLTRYLLPKVTAYEQQANPSASGAEAMGWLPPPLMGEGNKVQTGWLHDFLLEPYPIRPASFLRMPKFNMSDDEATALVNYFAARDNATYPYVATESRNDDLLASAEAKYAELLQKEGLPASTRFDDAMKIVVDKNYCVKCHIVADFSPVGSQRARAPNLADVYRRLRPDYLRRWIANPKSILPYTSMPVNIPYNPNVKFDGGVSQNLYHGTSVDQVDGLVDLLMNYDRYTKGAAKISPLVEAASGAAPPVGEAPPGEQPAAPIEATPAPAPSE